jgi:hypothetical protein
VSVRNADLQNLRVAVATARETGRLDDGARLVSALHDYAIWRQRFEIGDWARALLDMSGAARHPHAPVLFATAGWGRCIAGDFDVASELARQGLAAEAEVGTSCGWLHDVLAHAQFFQARNEDGLEHSRAEVVRARAAADRYRLAYVLADNAAHEYMVGHLDRARVQAEEALQLAELVGCPSITGMAYVARSMTSIDIDPQRSRTDGLRAAEAAESVGAAWIRGVVAVWLALLAADRPNPADELILSRDAVIAYYRAGDEVRVRNVVQSCLPALLAMLGSATAADLVRLNSACTDRPLMRAQFIDARIEPLLADLRTILGPRFDATADEGRRLSSAATVELACHLLTRAIDAARSDMS